ncbi:hypothetical protein EDD37DRAFT_647649 [Exophiala viscosa]|uniref:Uncharacterized protein n=1 Tax=Exophiala viscosa TaxID=2486360 RepID=A0AAN6E7W3_9EURO|nr:hypothetical protein EDD36DRAFT_43796 [Exophiala viscosa]KAI1627989.1 hypothetical protein EDD37DRAFT_647649 [Exophiala viscosa]
MRAEIRAVTTSKTKYAAIDPDYRSEFWNDKTEASEVFFNPSITTGQGTRQLIAIAEKGLAEFSQTLGIASRNVTSLHKGVLQAKINAYNHNAEAAREGITDNLVDVDKAGRAFVGQIECERKCGALAAHLVQKFEQLQKIAMTVLAEQTAHGDMVMKKVDSLKKVTIGIKCVDNVWPEIILGIQQLKHMTDAADAHRNTLMPSLGGTGMKLIEMEVEKSVGGGDEDDDATVAGDEDDDAEKPRVFYIVDAEEAPEAEAEA